MTFQEVKQILEDTNFDFDCCSIFNGPMVKLGDGVVVIKDGDKYKVFFVERHELFDVEEFTSEHDACKNFIMKLHEDFPQLYDFPKHFPQIFP